MAGISTRPPGSRARRKPRVVRCPILGAALDQSVTLCKLERDGSDIGAFVGAKGRQHDDLVFAAILAEVAWKEWLRPVMINESYTYESVNMPQNTSAGQNRAKFVESVVNNFFKAKEEASEQFDDRPQYLVDRGLA